MDADRMDGIARRAGSRRGFLASVLALLAGLASARRSDAYGVCSSAGGFCGIGLMCCPGYVCTYEYNPYVGRCGTLNTDGTIAPPPPLETLKGNGSDGAANRNRNGRRSRRTVLRYQRRQYRLRRKRDRL